MIYLIFWLFCGLAALTIMKQQSNEAIPIYMMATIFLCGPFLLLMIIAFLHDPLGLQFYFDSLNKKMDKMKKDLEIEHEKILREFEKKENESIKNKN